MKNVFIIILAGFIPTYLHAQQTSDTSLFVNSRTLIEIHGGDTVYIDLPVSDETTVDGTKFTYIERMPVPTIDVTQYITRHIIYPKDALKSHKQGKVVVKFVVTKTGKIADAVIAKGCYPSLDAEALRLIENMPDWTPGRNGGQPADVWYALPVIFELPK